MIALRSLATVVSLVLATASVGAFVVGCSGGASAKSASVKPGPMPEDETWTGVYYHPVFGYLHMQEEGAAVVGRWKRTDHSKWGELSGTRTGNVLHFAWKEHQVGMVGASATTHGKGFFVYKVNDEKIGVLTGRYGLGDEESEGDWNCVKQLRMPPDIKSIGGDSEGVAPGQL